MAARIEARLGRSLFVRAPDAIVVVEGRVQASDEGAFSALIRVGGPDGEVFGERLLEIPAGASCSQLDALAELVVAITLRGQGGATGIPLPAGVAEALDALFGDEPSELDPSTLPDAPVAPPAALQQQEDEAPPEAPPPPLVFGIAIGMAGASGLQPSGTFGPFGHLRLSIPGALSLIATGNYGFAQTDGINGSDGRVRYHVWRAGLSGCLPEHHALASQLTLCVQAAAGMLTTKASRFDALNAPTNRQWMAQLAVEGRARAPIIGPLGLVITARLPVRLVRPSIAVQPGDNPEPEVFDTTPLGVEGEFGLDLAF